MTLRRDVRRSVISVGQNVGVILRGDRAEGCEHRAPISQIDEGSDWFSG
jgi:hypothetical protein